MSSFIINPYSFKATLLPQEFTETLDGEVAISALVYEDVPFTNQTETLDGEVAISALVYEDVPNTSQTETLDGEVEISNLVYSEPDGSYWYNGEWFNESKGYDTMGNLDGTDNWFTSDPYDGDTMAGDGAAIVEVAGYTNATSGSKSLSFVDFPQNDLVSFYQQGLTNPDPFFDGVKADLFFALYDNEDEGDPDKYEFELVGEEGGSGIIRLLFTPVSGSYRIDRVINETTTNGPVTFSINTLFKLSVHLKPTNKADITLQQCNSSGVVSGTPSNLFTNSDITSTAPSSSLMAVNIFTDLTANGASSPGPIKLLVNNLTIRTRLT